MIGALSPGDMPLDRGRKENRIMFKCRNEHSDVWIGTIVGRVFSLLPSSHSRRAGYQRDRKLIVMGIISYHNLTPTHYLPKLPS